MTATVETDCASYQVLLPGSRQLTVVDKVTISIQPGEIVAIEGRSGSGKTTLLSMMGLLTSPTHGDVRIAGRSARQLSDAEAARVRNEQIGFVFQSYSLARHLNAAQNAALPLRYGKTMRRREAKQRAAHVLDLVGLTDRARSRPQQLSGGEQQRVAIARALVKRPQLVLADEPTGALDTETADAVAELFFNVAREYGCAVVVVTHDRRVATMCGRRLVLDAGRLVDGPP